MNEVRNKVMTEIFLAPSVVLPIVGGISSLMLSWAMGGVLLLTAGGLVGVLGGFGWMATRAIFSVEAITEKVVQEIRAKEKRAEEEELDQLMRKLRTDRDHRNDEYLIILRSIKSEFERAATAPGVESRSSEVVLQVRQLFSAAIQQLHRSHEIWELSERLMGEEKKRILNQREQVLSEVKTTVDHLRSATEQYLQLMKREQQVDLSQLRDELDASLRIAKRTEERMREIEMKPSYDNFMKE